MPIDRYTIKADARERLRSAVPRPYYEGLLFLLIAAILSGLSAAFLLSHFNREAFADYVQYTQDVAAAVYANPSLTLDSFAPAVTERLSKVMEPLPLIDETIRYALALLQSFVKAMEPLPLIDEMLCNALALLQSFVAVGLTIFSMNTLRQKDASLWNLFDGFGRFLPLLLLLLVTWFLLYIWTSLLVIPGIIAFYRYRLAVYLLLDHPELNPIQCLLLSGQMMRGRKWELFVLDLSFLGWGLLASLPLSIGSLFGLVPMILGALGSAAILAWLLPYYEMSCVGFYDTIKTPIRSIPPERG